MFSMTGFFFFLESWGQQSMIMALQFAELSYSKLNSDRSLYLNPVRLIFVRDQAK